MTAPVFHIHTSVRFGDGREAPYVLTLTEAAELLRIVKVKNPHRSVHELCRRHKVRIRKISGRAHILLPELLALIDRIFEVAAGDKPKHETPQHQPPSGGHKIRLADPT